MGAPRPTKRPRTGKHPRTSKRPRKPQQRSEDTKLKLTRATIELMVERGHARLSVTDITARAGVSTGARVHHFPMKSDLVIAAIGQFLQHGNRSGTERARKAATPQALVRAMIDDLYSLYFEELFIPSMEAAIAARTDAVLARGLHPVVAEYHRTNRTIWIAALTRGGYGAGDATMLYETCKWVLRGMALTAVWRPSPRENRRFLRRLEDLLHRAVPTAPPKKQARAPVFLTPARRER